MNLVTFNYTKAPGNTTERVLYPAIFPNKMYEGIDCSELDLEQQALFVAECEAVKLDYMNKLKEIQEKFDLRNRYRRFDPTKMSNVVTESI